MKKIMVLYQTHLTDGPSVRGRWIWPKSMDLNISMIRNSLKFETETLSWIMIFLRMLIIGGRGSHFCCNIVQEVMNPKKVDRHKRYCKTLKLNELNHISNDQMVDLISLLKYYWSYFSSFMVLLFLHDVYLSSKYWVYT